LLRIDAAQRMAAALASAHRDQLLSLEQHDSATRTQESEQPTPRAARDLPYDSSGTTGAGASGHKRDVALAESAGAAAPSGAQQRPEPFPPKSARAPVLPMQPHPPVSSTCCVACCVLGARCVSRCLLSSVCRCFLLRSALSLFFFFFFFLVAQRTVPLYSLSAVCELPHMSPY